MEMTLEIRNQRFYSSHLVRVKMQLTRGHPLTHTHTHTHTHTYTVFNLGRPLCGFIHSSFCISMTPWRLAFFSLLSGIAQKLPNTYLIIDEHLSKLYPSLIIPKVADVARLKGDVSKIFYGVLNWDNLTHPLLLIKYVINNRMGRLNTSDLPASLSPSSRFLSTADFRRLAEVPAEVEWFANIDNPQTRRAYQNALQDFMKFAGIARSDEFRDITRAHVIA